jgi:hypothetical protein
MERSWRQGTAIWRQINDHDEIVANATVGPFGRLALKHPEVRNLRTYCCSLFDEPRSLYVPKSFKTA